MAIAYDALCRRCGKLIHILVCNTDLGAVCRECVPIIRAENPKCLHDGVPVGAIYCSKCGYKLEREIEKPTKNCVGQVYLVLFGIPMLIIAILLLVMCLLS